MSQTYYRNTTIGRALKKTLQELIRAKKLTPNQANRVLAEFDESIAASFDCATEDEFSFEANKIVGCSSINDKLVVALKDVKLSVEDETFTSVDRLNLVVCGCRNSIANDLPEVKNLFSSSEDESVESIQEFKKRKI